MWYIIIYNPEKTYMIGSQFILTNLIGLKQLRVLFVLKPGENSFSLWPARIRFGSAVPMHIVYANFGVDFRGLEAIQVRLIFP